MAMIADIITIEIAVYLRDVARRFTVRDSRLNFQASRTSETIDSVFDRCSTDVKIIGID